MDTDETAEMNVKTTKSRSEARGLRLVRYGLPCANCHAYYAAELEACPICHCEKRVPPVAAVTCVAAAF